MRIGSPKEIKNHEYRVGLTPAAVRELTARGHIVMIECHAGDAIGLSDDVYRAAGALLVHTADELFAVSDLIVKVKEPQPSEIARLRPGQTLFTYLHLAPDRAQAIGLMASDTVCIAYETVTDSRGGLPLLAPMSEVAGRMSIQAGARALEIASGGRGMLLGGVPGVAPAHVAILGGGVVGVNAARMALGLGAQVTLLDIDLHRLANIDAQFSGRVMTRHSTLHAVEEVVLDADLVIGGVLVPGARAPRLITEEMVWKMRKGAVIVDVAVDQGGCAETTHATTHADPTYILHEVVHYCVANMPGAVARTSTFALGNATLPFILALADKGVTRALSEDVHLRNGLNVWRGAVTHAAVAAAIGEPCTPAEKALGA